MNKNKIDQIFRKTFNCKTNFMTPYVIDRDQVGHYIYELSWGQGFGSRKIYGVTVLTLDGEKTELSQGGFSHSEAYKYIAELEEVEECQQ